MRVANEIVVFFLFIALFAITGCSEGTDTETEAKPDVSAVVSDTIDNVTESVQAGAEKVAEQAESVGESVAETTEETVEAVDESSEAVVEGMESAEQGVLDAAEAVKEGAEEVKQGISDAGAAIETKIESIEGTPQPGSLPGEMAVQSPTPVVDVPATSTEAVELAAPTAESVIADQPSVGEAAGEVSMPPSVPVAP